MNPNAATFLAVGGAVLTPTLFGVAARAGLVHVTPYVTAAQAAAWASLSPPILGITSGQHAESESSAFSRAQGIQLALIPLRGAAANNVAKLTADDLDELLNRFLAAAAAGVDHGYRVTSTSVFDGLASANLELQKLVMDKLTTGKRPAAGEIVPGKVALTLLGDAVLAAAVEKNRVRLLGGFGLADAKTGAQLVARLAIEMDDQGYLITGKPPEDPTIAGGLGAAFDAVAELPGAVIAKGAELGLSAAFSKLGMLAIAGFVVWKVATR